MNEAIVGVNGDTDQAALKRTVTTHEITWRSFHDRSSSKPAISQEWKITGWPTLCLIDQKDVIREKWLDCPPLVRVP